MVNVVIVAVLIALIALVIWSMVKDKKAGRSSCGGSCASCGACHMDFPDAEAIRSANTVYETRVSVDGMMCGMCEAHVNDAVRRAISPQKVKSSFSKGETVIVTRGKPDLEAIRSAIDSTGYTVTGMACKPQ